ncbi:hypothetical protein IQ279_14000 [Streptomyces verrucosisporus]|uniref:hypothetical protein n=1 Tax=Streptomyces verrucosisporus TaxID=1695161 RepID=UPI0019D2DB26|nr:hypothetical protein [Streptomyces verrucosisporus]MBN3930733.1 hypothetical protein [Streptomyces verrucosisporus]
MEAERRQPETTAQDAPAGASGHPPGAGAVPMRDLLASCAAADAVSTPPAPERRTAAGERPDDEGPRAEAA